MTARQQAVGGCAEDGDDEETKPVGRRKYISTELTLEILEREGCFEMPQLQAAKHLGFSSATSLKNVGGRCSRPTARCVHCGLRCTQTAAMPVAN